MLYQRRKSWDLIAFGKNDKLLMLESVNLDIAVSDIYARTEL